MGVYGKVHHLVLNLFHCLWTNIIRLVHDVLIWDVKKRHMKHQHIFTTEFDCILTGAGCHTHSEYCLGSVVNFFIDTCCNVLATKRY